MTATRAFLACAAAGAILSGCSVTKVEEHRCEGPAGELEIKVLRRANPRDLKGGYSFHVARENASLGGFESDAPVLLTGLEPGPYRVAITGGKLKEERIVLQVKPGRRTRLLVLHYNARRLERLKECAETTGEILAEVAGAVAHAVAWMVRECIQECLFGDDDDDDEDCPRPSRPEPPKPREPRRFSNYLKP